MRDHQDSLALLAVEVGQQVQDGVGVTRVEVAGRLVGQQQCRPADHRPGDRDPLLLADGKLSGFLVGEIGQSPTFPPHFDLPVEGLLANLQRQRYVSSGTDRRQQVEPLKDKADRLPPQSRALTVRKPQRLAASDVNTGGLRRRHHQAQDVQQRRLAAARRPHDAQELTPADLQVNPVQHRLDYRAVLVGVMHPCDVDHQLSVHS